jgi:hypothetical protein
MEIPLLNVTHSLKEEKMGLGRGMVARLKMYWEINQGIKPFLDSTNWGRDIGEQSR